MEVDVTRCFCVRCIAHDRLLVTVSYSATSHRRQSDAHHYPTSFLRIHTLYTKGLQALRLVFIRRHMSLRLRVVLRIARAITTENGKVRFTIFWATTRSAPLSCRYSLTSQGSFAPAPRAVCIRTIRSSGDRGWRDVIYCTGK